MAFPEKKYFTVFQAERLLPEVEQILKRLAAIQQTLSAFDQIKLRFEDHFQAAAHEVTKNKNFHKLNHDLYGAVEELVEMGVILKDMNKGLVDFYSKFNGREIFLCWQLGEKRVGHWHELHTGFEGRRPVSELMNA